MLHLVQSGMVNRAILEFHFFTLVKDDGVLMVYFREQTNEDHFCIAKFDAVLIAKRSKFRCIKVA